MESMTNFIYFKDKKLEKIRSNDQENMNYHINGLHLFWDTQYNCLLKIIISYLNHIIMYNQMIIIK